MLCVAPRGTLLCCTAMISGVPGSAWSGKIIGVNGEQTTAKNIYAIGDVLHNPKVGATHDRCWPQPFPSLFGYAVWSWLRIAAPTVA
jgi:hypothetical protein